MIVKVSRSNSTQGGSKAIRRRRKAMVVRKLADIGSRGIFDTHSISLIESSHPSLSSRAWVRCLAVMSGECGKEFDLNFSSPHMSGSLTDASHGIASYLQITSPSRMSITSHYHHQVTHLARASLPHLSHQQEGQRWLPIQFRNLGLLQNKFVDFIFLTLLKGFVIFPSEQGVAIGTENI
jgi:hypothetical protein